MPTPRNNDRLLLSGTHALGLGRYDMVPEILPVLILDADAPVPPQYKGCQWVNVAAGGAGNRSEILVHSAGPKGSLVKVWLDIVVHASPTLIRMAASLAGGTLVTAPYSDQRLGSGGNGNLFLATKNSAAATATGTVNGLGIGGNMTAGQLVPGIGPFWLPGYTGSADSSLIIQAGADNTVLSAGIHWEFYDKVK